MTHRDLDPAIEASARALYEEMGIGPWEEASYWIQESVRGNARTCIEAALPYLRA